MSMNTNKLKELLVSAIAISLILTFPASVPVYAASNADAGLEQISSGTCFGSNVFNYIDICRASMTDLKTA